eukprot:Skav215972  [mRNA]  locus=scaffold3174:49035:50223:+ [translate_table: standard]
MPHRIPIHRSPRSIVVMFHGLNDSALCCAAGVAKSWAKLPGTLVVVPQSPDRSLWSDSSDPGYDWLRQNGRQDTNDSAANVRELQRATMARVRHVERWLRALLKKHKLKRRCRAQGLPWDAWDALSSG